jgi:molecular chaperone HtpG
MRRMIDMQKSNGGSSPFFFGEMPLGYVLSVNGNHTATQKLLQLEGDAQRQLAQQLLDLALLNQNMLTGAELTAFVQRTVNGLI